MRTHATISGIGAAEIVGEVGGERAIGAIVLD